MGIIHTYADNSYGIGHKSGMDCSCQPTRNVKHIPISRGKRGSHQGYRQAVTINHNVLTK